MIQNIHAVVSNENSLSETLQTLLEKHEPFIRAILQSHIRCSADRDDIFQDYLLSMLQSSASPDLLLNKNFIYRAVHNDSIDHARKQKTYRTAIQNYAQNPRGSSPDTAHLVPLCRNIFRFARKHLPPHLLIVLRLRFVHQCSYHQIAQKLNIQNASARRYLCIAIKQLRNALIAENQYDTIHSQINS